MKTRTCRVCGCTDLDCSQCIEKTGFPCHWVEADLCSACVDPPDLAGNGIKLMNDQVRQARKKGALKFLATKKNQNYFIK